MCSGMHYARPTAGIEPTPPCRGTAGRLRRRLSSLDLAIALWSCSFVVMVAPDCQMADTSWGGETHAETGITNDTAGLVRIRDSD